MGKTSDWLEAHRDYPHRDWCLIWPFARESRVGRGVMGANGRSGWAHRFMCELVHGPAPADRPQAAHSCGNGHEGCVNPLHLSWASNSENQLQRYAHGRVNNNANGNKGRFTSEQIDSIRAQWGEFTQVKLAEIYGCSLGTIQYYLKYRDQRGHSGSKVNHWRPEEEMKLREGISRGLTFNELAPFVGRARSAVEMKAYRLGLKSGRAPNPRSTQANGER
jgi:hypothetical protein